MYNINVNPKADLNFKGKIMPSDELKSLHQSYEQFLKDMGKNDLSNSPQRYIVERNIVKTLRNEAVKFHDKQMLQYYNDRFDEITKKLDEFGIQISDD